MLETKGLVWGNGNFSSNKKCSVSVVITSLFVHPNYHSHFLSLADYEQVSDFSG